ncbi:endonuclease [Candidatus Poribacteria bacterium]|nr:endonuclease [Candidatus Poribacteria bacterium]
MKENLKLMTVNLRYGTAKDEEYVWENRLPVMMEMLNTYRPDVFGVQEGLRFQIDQIIEHVPGYACFGEGRDGLGESEHVAIFYNVNRIHCIQGNTLWLSETPEVPGSKSWESSLSRLVTWGRFQIKSTGFPFCFYNTHFDHRSEIARQESAKLVWSRIKDHSEQCFFTGDFNCTEESFAWKYLTEKDRMTDAWHAAENQENPVSTYHGYKGPNEKNTRIDWILMRPDLRVIKAETVIFQKDGMYPSDHYPVFAEVEMP